MQGVRFEGRSEPAEIKVMGDPAYVRNHIVVKVIPYAGGETKTRAGYPLTIFTRAADGRVQGENSSSNVGASGFSRSRLCR